jgi:predicted permease
MLIGMWVVVVWTFLQLVFSLFLPCLIFTQLGKTVSVEKILQWWFIPVNIVLGAILGCMLGYLVALIVRPPPQFFKFFIVMIGIGKEDSFFHSLGLS